jgi:DNA-binding NarL/FixJ family response regulator
VHQDFVRESLNAGALGYVTKSRLASDLPLAIHEALASRTFVSPSLAGENGF